MAFIGKSARAALIALLAAGSARAETLREAIEAARTDNPRLAAARSSYLQSTAQTAIAAARGRPTVNFSANVVRDFDSDPYGNRIRDESRLELALPLYAGGRIRQAVKTQAALADAAASTAVARENQLGSAVVDAYVGVLDARDTLRLAGAEVDRLSGYRTMIGQEKRHGLIGSADVAQATARLARARVERIDAARRLALARETYRNIVGHYPGDLAEPPALPAPPSLEDADRIARTASPALRSLRQKIDAAAHAVSVRRAAGRPVLSMRANVSYGNSSADIAQPRRFPHRLFGEVRLSLTIPLYSGGQVTGEVRRAEAARREAEQEAIAGERAIVAQVNDALLDYRGATADAALSADAAEAGRDALKGVDIGRSVGDRTNLDLLNAAGELYASEVAHGHATRRAYRQAYAAMTAMGRSADEILGGATPAGTAAATPAHASGLGAIAFDLSALDGSHAVTPAAATARTAGPIAYALADLG